MLKYSNTIAKILASVNADIIRTIWEDANERAIEFFKLNGYQDVELRVYYQETMLQPIHKLNRQDLDCDEINEEQVESERSHNIDNDDENMVDLGINLNLLVIVNLLCL